MDPKEFYYNSLMSNQNDRNYSFPYFASKENQTIYVFVPSVFSQLHENSSKIENFATEEEIFPDFRCKICSVTMLTYSEFKVHQQNHEKVSEEALKKFIPSRSVQVHGPDVSCKMKFDLSENIKYDEIFNHSANDSHLNATRKRAKLMPNSKIFPSEILSYPSSEAYKKLFPSSKPFATFHNSDSISDSFKKSVHVSKFKNPVILKFPLMQMMNESKHNTAAPIMSSHMITSLCPNENNTDVKSELGNKNMNLVFSNSMNSSKILQEGIVGRKNIHTANSISSNTVLTLTYTGLEEQLTASEKKKNASLTESRSAFSCFQSQLAMENKDTNTELKKSNLEGIFTGSLDEKEVSETTDTLNDSLSTSQQLGDLNSFDFSSFDYSYREKNITSEVVGHDKNSPSKINPLMSMGVSEQNVPIPESVTNTREQAKQEKKMKENASTENKESILGGIFRETLSEKEVIQPMEKLGLSFPTSQRLGNMCSLYYPSLDYLSREKNVRNEGMLCDKSSLLRMNPLQSIEVNDQNIPILESVTNAEEKVNIKVKASTEDKEPILSGIFRETSSKKGVIQPMENLSLPTSQPLGDISNSVSSNYSKFGISTEKNNQNKTAGCAESSPSNNNLFQSLEVTDRRVSILQPLSNAKEKILRCFYCRKNFNYRLQIIQHSLQHQEMKIIHCVLCESPFSSISNLRKHLLMFHCEAKDRRQCPHCNYRCFQNSDLKKHIARRHTGDFKYKCSCCIKGFATPKELSRHSAKKHSNRKLND